MNNEHKVATYLLSLIT